MLYSNTSSPQALITTSSSTLDSSSIFSRLPPALDHLITSDVHHHGPLHRVLHLHAVLPVHVHLLDALPGLDVLVWLVVIMSTSSVSIMNILPAHSPGSTSTMFLNSYISSISISSSFTDSFFSFSSICSYSILATVIFHALFILSTFYILVVLDSSSASSATSMASSCSLFSVS